jgi:opacity protein-like surface antigen
MNSTWDRPLARWVGLAAAPALLAAAPGASAFEGDPSYTYLGVGYAWNDVSYAVKQEGATHEGINVEGSLGLLEFGKFGLHLYGEFFDGDFATNLQVDGGEGTTVGVPDGDSRGYQLGLGLAYALSDRVDLIGRASYASTEVDLPDSQGQLRSVDGDGYVLHALVRGMVSDRVELEAGYRYTDISDVAVNGSGNDVSNSDVILALTYGVTDQFAVRVRGIVFDDDTGLEFGARWYFGRLIGRDHLFRF